MTPAEISVQLERVLSSPQFSQSRRLSRFLRFIVEAAQAGQSDSVKEYLIGVEVFDRGKDFDPRVDPIVRVQAAKLRSKLLEYYASVGAQDPIVINMPKGGYAPEIRDQKPILAIAVSAPAPDRSRIAVLPFLNMSTDPDNEYFSDGLTEELINRLARVPSLQVVARTSAFCFKGQNQDLREVGAKLNVGAVMEGSVRKAGDQLRVTAQLIDVQSGYHLFSQTYQREYKNIFELQDELARAVVDEIAPLSANPSSRVMVKTRTVNLDAYNKYLRGMYALSNRFTDRHQWIDSFREALAIDPEHAPAWAGLAYGYFMLAWLYQMPANEALALSREAALKTIGLDPDFGQGHSSIGVIKCAFEWDWASGEASFRRAIELQPGLAAIYSPFATHCLLPQSQMDEACAMMDIGVSLDPFDPMSRAAAVYAYGYAGHYENALRHQAFGLEVNPGFPPFFYTKGLIEVWQGHTNEAVSSLQKACDSGGNLPPALAALGHALASLGRKDQARRILERLIEIPDQPAVEIATVYLGLGAEEEALKWLETGIKQRNLRLGTVPADRRFRRLSKHPRFQAILKQMGLQTFATTA